MATALVALATTTLASSSATVTFSSLPTSGYRDLVLVMSVRNTTAGTGQDFLDIRFNGDTAGNYAGLRMQGSGTAASSSEQGANNTKIMTGLINEGNTTAGVFSGVNVSIFDYNQTDKHKTTLARSDAPLSTVAAWAGRWASTAAITSITIFPDNASWAAGSVFSLFGVTA